MNQNQHSRQILDQVTGLIRRSCLYKIPEYQGFQVALLKKHFKSHIVEIDEQEQCIKLINPDRKQGVKTLSFNNGNLEKVLLDCLDDDLISLNFYKSLLAYYSQFSPNLLTGYAS